ncbi:MAG: GNAT family N-acetyltransferase [Bacteroidetes bacterium]|nr:GNAT family N-acetyltransferase [Bacteroidota bacterium]
MVYREAKETDLPFILELMNWAIVNTTSIYDYDIRNEVYVEEWFKLKKNYGFPILVLEVDNVSAGFASYGTFRAWDGFHRTVEHSIYLSPKFQGLGLGEGLLNEISSVAKNQGLHAIIGGVDGSNQNSIRLHEKCGFVEVGRLPQVGFKFERYLDLVFMQKLLS